MGAPVVLAKGYDAIAQRIKAIAAENNIPMVENIELARALAKETEIGRAIAPKWFKAVAEILAAVYKLRRWFGKIPDMHHLHPCLQWAYDFARHQ